MNARFARRRTDWISLFFTGATGFATFLIVAMLGVILGNILLNGAPHLSWRLLSGDSAKDMFDVSKAGLLPLIIGTSERVLLMTIAVIPVGVTTAIYLTEYAPKGAQDAPRPGRPRRRAARNRAPGRRSR